MFSHNDGQTKVLDMYMYMTDSLKHDDVIKWKHFPRHWSFVSGIHRFSLICAWISSWVNNLEDGDLRRHRTHYDVIVMEGELLYDFNYLPGAVD